MNGISVIGIIGSVLSVAISVFASYLIVFRRRRNNERQMLIANILYFFGALLLLAIVIVLPSPPKDTTRASISTQIKEIAETLSESSVKISNIQKELETRIEYVEDLKAEAQIAENVIRLNEDQVNAIQAKLREELTSNNSQGLFQDILINTAFFLLGFLPTALRFIRNKRRKKGHCNTEDSINTKYSAEQIEQAIKLLDTIDLPKK